MPRLFGFVIAMLLSVQAAQAHTGVGDTSGLVHGFLHPVGGIDHILAMVAVGIFAALLGGRSLWLLPVSFVTVMVAGGVLGMAGVSVPLVEIGIGLSIVGLGAVIALAPNMPVAMAMALVAAFAVFHGQAHGAELPAGASGFAFVLGFVAATALLHLTGIALALAVGRIGQVHARRYGQVAGGLVAFAGTVYLTGLV